MRKISSSIKSMMRHHQPRARFDSGPRERRIRGNAMPSNDPKEYDSLGYHIKESPRAGGFFFTDSHGKMGFRPYSKFLKSEAYKKYAKESHFRVRSVTNSGVVSNSDPMSEKDANAVRKQLLYSRAIKSAEVVRT